MTMNNGRTRKRSSAQQVTNVRFTDPKRPKLGVEVLTYESLLERDLQAIISTPHRLDFYQIVFFTKGRGIHTVDEERMAYTRGTVFMVGKGRVQRFAVEPRSRAHLLVFTPEFALRFFNEAESARAFALFDEQMGTLCIQLIEYDVRSLELLFTQVKEEYELQEGTEEQQALLRAAVQFILLRLRRLSPARERVSSADVVGDMQRFKELLEANWRSSRAVDDYAARMRITPKRLSAITSSAVGRTPKQCIQEHVLLEVKRLMINARLSIKEVAYDAGFDEPTNLVKFFRKATGTTPTAYREGLR